MPTFVSLISLTQHGEEDIKHSVERADAFRETAEKFGARIKDVYWTMGGYDGVLVFEAADDATATSLMLHLASKGNVRTQTLRAFNSEEFTSVLDAVP